MFLTTNRQSPSSDCSTPALPNARQLLVPSFALGFKSKLSVWASAKMVITVIQSGSRVNLVICFNIIYFSRRQWIRPFERTQQRLSMRADFTRRRTRPPRYPFEWRVNNGRHLVVAKLARPAQTNARTGFARCVELRDVGCGPRREKSDQLLRQRAGRGLLAGRKNSTSDGRQEESG